MHADPLLPVLLLLLAGVLGIVASERLGVSPIVGLFAAGALVGPHVLGWIRFEEPIPFLAELGVAFLLFDVGIHLSPTALRDARSDLLGLGPAQIALAAGVLALAATALGRPPRESAILGAGLALSSTAVVMETLRERGEHATPLGRSAVAVLIAQDLFAVVLLAVLPALAAAEGGLAPQLARTVVALASAGAAVLLLSRGVLTPLFARLVRTRRDELFTAAALLLVLAIAWGAHRIGLSYALGAFLAGLALAGSRFAHLVRNELAPFRGLLLALFFLTIGIQLDLPLVLERAPAVVAAGIGFVALKALAALGSARLLGLRPAMAGRLGATLAQGSEFFFVLSALAAAEGLLDPVTARGLGAAVALSMAATPALVGLGARLAARAGGPDEAARGAERADSAPRIVLVGFDAFARRLACILAQAGEDFVVVTSDREQAAEARALGFEALYGHPDRPRALSLAAVGAARAVVVALQDPQVAVGLVRALGEAAPSVPVYAATDDLAAFEALSALPVRDVVRKGPATAEQLARALRGDLDCGSARLESCIQETRRAESQSLGGDMRAARAARAA